MRWSRVDPSRCASSSFLCVCSTTTIAASTSSPIAIAMPPSDMMFAVIPSARNGMNATRTATGMVMSGMSALGDVPQEQQHDEGHGEHHLDERLAHVVDGAADQRRAVVDRDDLHPWRQARLDLADALLHPIDHVDRVLSLAHDDDARHHFAGAVQVGHAAPQIRADRHLRRCRGSGSACRSRWRTRRCSRSRRPTSRSRGRAPCTRYRRTRSADRQSPRCRRAPRRRHAGSTGRSCAAGSGPRSPGTDGRSRRARPPPTRRAPPSGSSAGASPGTTADPPGYVCPSGPRARTGTPSRARSRRARVRSANPAAAATARSRGTPSSACAPSRYRCRLRKSRRRTSSQNRRRRGPLARAARRASPSRSDT